MSRLSDCVCWLRLKSLFDGANLIGIVLLPNVGGTPGTLKLGIAISSGIIYCTRISSVSQKFLLPNEDFLSPVFCLY